MTGTQKENQSRKVGDVLKTALAGNIFLSKLKLKKVSLNQSTPNPPLLFNDPDFS
jgi:hypothetical protein